MDAIRTLIRAGMKMIAQNSEAIKEVAVAQKATEAELRTFINSLRRGGNGHSRKN